MPTLDEIVENLRKAEMSRDVEMPEFTTTRRYVLRNKRLSTDAEMMVKVHYRAGHGKSFEVLSTANASGGLPRRVFERLIDGETEASRKGTQVLAFTPDNYKFEMAGSESTLGRTCFVLNIAPKKKHKYLIEGRIWVDAADFQVIRMEGRPSASPSFWTGRPHLVQEFQKVGNHWMSFKNRSLTDARFIGRTELLIEYTDYRFPVSTAVTVRGQRAAH